MAGRIRRGTLSIAGAAQASVSNFEWTDAREFDRSKGDDEWSGQPVEMDRKGSGSFTLLSGNVASGYALGDIVLTYKDVSVVNGVETVTSKTATFTLVTFNNGGSVPAEGRGEIRISFDYGVCTIA